MKKPTPVKRPSPAKTPRKGGSEEPPRPREEPIAKDPNRRHGVQKGPTRIGIYDIVFRDPRFACFWKPEDFVGGDLCDVMPGDHIMYYDDGFESRVVKEKRGVDFRVTELRGVFGNVSSPERTVYRNHVRQVLRVASLEKTPDEAPRGVLSPDTSEPIDLDALCSDGLDEPQGVAEVIDLDAEVIDLDAEVIDLDAEVIDLDAEVDEVIDLDAEEAKVEAEDGVGFEEFFSL